MEVPKISCQEGAEVAKTVPQDRLAERSQVVEVPKISCRVTAEVAILQRTEEQHISTRGMSLLHDSLKGFVNGQSK